MKFERNWKVEILYTKSWDFEVVGYVFFWVWSPSLFLDAVSRFSDMFSDFWGWWRWQRLWWQGQHGGWVWWPVAGEKVKEDGMGWTKLSLVFFVNGKNSPYHIRVYILVIYLTRWSMYHYSIIIPKAADIFRVTITFRKFLNYTTCICHATRTTLFSTRTQFMIFFFIYFN